MEVFVLIALGMILLLLGWQDFRQRQVKVLMLVLTLLLCSVLYALQNPLSGLPQRFLLNSALSATILVSGTLLVKLRRAGRTMSSFIGTGDFLFLIAISPMFSFEAYLVFLYTSFLLILAVYVFYRLLKKKDKEEKSIPLAGAQALYLLVLLIINEWVAMDLTRLSFNMFLR